MGRKLPSLYSTFADWFHLLTAPEEYAEEASVYTGMLKGLATPSPRTVLELGSGGGNNASHMKAHFELTLTDLSPQMLAVSRAINPECEHIQGDMRQLRLGRPFDAVFAHDALDYLLTLDDLARMAETAWAHCRPGGAVLDVACGSGRHARLLAAPRSEVRAVDRDPGLFPDPPPGVTLVGADLEAGPWPFRGRRFDGIVVANYLHRPLLPVLADSLEPGGVLVYETFARGNERFGRPSNPDFLLAPGELLELARGKLRVVAYEDLVVEAPRPSAVQRLCARREDPG